MTAKKRNLLMLFLLLPLLLSGCITYPEEYRSDRPFSDKLAVLLPDRQIGALGDPTDDLFDYTAVDPWSASPDVYAAIFIFPSAVPDLQTDPQTREVLHESPIPVVLIRCGDLPVSELFTGEDYPQEELGDIQIYKRFPKTSGSIRYYNSDLYISNYGYSILTDYLIAMNKYAEDYNTFLTIDSEIQNRLLNMDGDYFPVY